MLLGGEPLDTLEQWVKELFLAVPSGCGPRPAFGHLPRPYMVQHFHLLSLLALLACLQRMLAMHLAARMASGLGEHLRILQGAGQGQI